MFHGVIHKITLARFFLRPGVDKLSDYTVVSDAFWGPTNAAYASFSITAQFDIIISVGVCLFGT